MFLYISLFHTISGLTGKDYEFADDVDTAEVDTWVGLGIAFLLCPAHGLGERHVGADFVEDEVQRSRKDGLDMQNLVTGVAKVVDCSDDWQSGSDICLEKEFHASGYGSAFQPQIALIVAGSCNLIGRHDRNIMLEENLIQGCDVLRCRTVDKHTVEDVHADDAVA